MVTSSNGIFRVSGLLCGEFTGQRWIPLAKASDAELWCLLWSAPETTVEQTIWTPSRSSWRHCYASCVLTRHGPIIVYTYDMKGSLPYRRISWQYHSLTSTKVEENNMYLWCAHGKPANRSIHNERKLQVDWPVIGEPIIQSQNVCKSFYGFTIRRQKHKKLRNTNMIAKNTKDDWSNILHTIHLYPIMLPLLVGVEFSIGSAR